MKFFKVLCVGLLTASCMLSSAGKETFFPVSQIEQGYERYPEVVVKVIITDAMQNPIGWGSGVIIKSDNGSYKVLTAKHVVDSGKESLIFVELNGKLSQQASQVFLNPTRDAAILTIPSDWKEEAVDLQLEVVPGQEVLSVGFPMGMEFIMAQGITNYRSVTQPGLWMCTAPIAPGNSGGGVFNEENGELIGICIAVGVFSTWSGSQSVDHIHFFLPVADIKSWIDTVVLQ